MANTYTLISSSTVGSGGTASFTFSSIPATYTDLLVKASLRSTGGVGSYRATFNSSATGYSETLLYSDGSSVGSASASSGTYINWIFNTNGFSSTASVFSNCEFYIPNYASANQKSISSDNVTEQNASGSAQRYLDNALWANTAAITSITLTMQGTTPLFAEHSTFYLYGIKNS